jgi:NAD+ synthase (glutamine-hydrolysing)
LTSTKTTGIPFWAKKYAASEPAKPAPTTKTFGFTSTLISPVLMCVSLIMDLAVIVNLRENFLGPLFIHQTHHTIVDFDGIFETLKKAALKPGLHLFPEMFLTGYPLQDLCLQASFIRRYNDFLQQVTEWSKTLPANTVMLMGGVEYKLMNPTLHEKIYNVIFELKKDSFKSVYRKRLLPNYDIFDERKYFTPGEGNTVYEFEGKKIALLICEDMWPSTFHDLDPVEEYAKLNTHFDLIVNLSASPFAWNKRERRIARAMEISHYLKAPFVYVNRVGAEDEVIFDGQSFLLIGDQLLEILPAFVGHELNCDLPVQHFSPKHQKTKTSYTWESLMYPAWVKGSETHLKTWEPDDCQSVFEALKFGLQEYAQKNGFKKFLIAFSGGVDSALVLAITKLSLKPGQSVEAIYMPSIHSSTLSYDLCYEMCQKLEVPLTSFPIKFLHSTVKNQFTQTFSESFEGLTDENIQSRLRGMLIYTRSNQTGAMVINTSNRSELAVGYSTQYGDSVGALSILGDVYKTEVYQLCDHLNKLYPGIIPEKIITRPPTAELREGQKDTDSLPPYRRLDTILEGIISYRADLTELAKCGFDPAEVSRVFDLYSLSEYKRAQFCPILKIKAKSFGFGYRIPISKKRDFYRR